MAKKLKHKEFAVFITDLHLNKDNGELVRDIMNQVISLCKKRNIKYVFCGGDIFTSRSSQPLYCLTTWDEILDDIKKANLYFEAIPGNHDKTDVNDERNYLDIYRWGMNVHRSGSVRIYDGIVVAFIPYFQDDKWLEEYQKVEELIDSMLFEGNINDDFKKILITHSGFDGVMNNDGSKVNSLIKPSMFKDWDKVLIGHYHNASKLADNVIYTGSTYQNNYGETFADKGCTIIYYDGDIEFVPLKFPRYIKEVLDVNDKDTLNNLIEKYEGENYDNVRFVFRGNKVDANKVDTAKLAAIGIDAKYEAVETEEAIMNSLSDDNELMSFDRKSIMRDFVKFCSENKIKGKHLQYGLKLIKTI